MALEKEILVHAAVGPHISCTVDPQLQLQWDRTFILAYGKLASDDEPFEFVGTAVYNRCGIIDASNYVSIVRPKFLNMLEAKLSLFDGGCTISRIS